MGTSGGSGDPHLEIGQTLALARRERGLSLKDVEEATKIRAAYLSELERENFDVLPAVYVQGSLKTYANFLQLNGDALVRELKRRRVPAGQEPQEAAPAEPRLDGPADRRPAVLKGLPAAKGAVRAFENRAPSGSLPASTFYVYLALGVAALAVLALVAAVLASTLAWKEESAVSKVREPLIAQAPEATLVADGEPADPPRNARNPGDRDDGSDDGDPRSPSPSAGSEGVAKAPPAAQALAAGEARGAREAAAPMPPQTAQAEPLAAQAEPQTAQAEPLTAQAEPRAGGGAPEAEFVIPAPRDDLRTSPPSDPPPGAPALQRGPITTSPNENFEVRIEVGGEKLVQITGHPTGAR